MMNELTRPLTDAEEGLWQEKLAALLVRQIALYTANESSSVPAAAARELLRGVLFFLAVPEEPDGGGEADRAARIRTLLSCDLADELAHGQHRAQRDAALTLAAETCGKPTVIILNTVKGYGSPVMEDKAAWHHHLPNDEEYAQIIADFAAHKEAING